MPQARSQVSRSRSIRIPGLSPEVLILALLAMLVVQMFRADQHRWLPALWIETIVFGLIPFLVLGAFLSWTSYAREWESRQTYFVAQGGAVLVGSATIGWQLAARLSGLGDANEIVALVVIQNVAWYLAVFSRVPGFERTCLVLSGSVVFFVCCLTERFDIFFVAGAFAIFFLWWLLGHYWNRLHAKAIDGHSRMLPIHGTTIVIAVLVIVGAAAIAYWSPVSRAQLSIDGFLPFSGGEHGYQDDFARSGIGDGHMLTAGKNATTAGAVDSEEFIQDDKPSIYDVMTDMYDGPAFKKKRHRAVAIDVIAKHMHDIKRSEQEGRTFRTMRDSEKTADLELEDKVTEALFFVEGTVPARFTIDTFQHFDGWDWTKSAVEAETSSRPPIRLEKRNSKPVYRLNQSQPDYLTGKRVHQVKLMRLECANLPTPAFLNRWHIPRVEQEDYFRWGEAGLIEIDGNPIPSHTVIDLESFVPNYHVMRAISDLRLQKQSNSLMLAIDKWIGVASDSAQVSHKPRSQNHLDRDSPFLQVPDNDNRETIAALAGEWTAGIEPGWNQVESIVGHMRKDFLLDPDWLVDQTVDDTVGHFLQQGGGPSYLFATTCAMALRSAGYKTRLSSGFLVRQQDYNRTARQSIVSKDNLHMWPEVCLDGKFWIPVEPTPGFPIPYSTQTVWQWATAQVWAIANWMVLHPVISISLAVATCLAVVFRADLIVMLVLCWWYLVRLFWPRGLLTATRQLIDFRFWAAGDKRPASETIQSWYSRVEPGMATGFFELWNAKNYSSRPVAVSGSDLVARCRQQVNGLTLQKIREFISNQKH